jgi:hypothetical protein
MEIIDKNMEKYSMSFVTGEIQIKPTKKYYFTLIRMTIIIALKVYCLRVDLLLNKTTLEKMGKKQNRTSKNLKRQSLKNLGG